MGRTTPLMKPALSPEHGGDSRVIGDVEGERQGTPTALTDEFGGFLEVLRVVAEPDASDLKAGANGADVGHHHVGARIGECQGDASSDPARPAGSCHQGDSSLEWSGKGAGRHSLPICEDRLIQGAPGKQPVRARGSMSSP
ncbi:hypothetical protein [Actinoplanes sp. M2I2]|uniref:hypothetical protein n=1 Tax=Actinoplanes sp. M2I2 TaxID=1734444 RepID=UPI0024C2199A|nr:hypothetical protein [Actinoplanes sp. M2I2]